MTRQPTLFVPHGGGPWPFVSTRFDAQANWAPLRAFLEALPTSLPAPPRAILCISAHWEAPVPTVQSAPRPPMLYDYSGFPEASYALSYPACTDAGLVQRVQDLLGQAGLASATDPARGYDHGAFVPLMLGWPDAQVPTVQLSLVRGLDPAEHLSLGRALAPLRDEGVLIYGSGQSFHDMRGFMRPAGRAASEPFHDWLADVVCRPPSGRDDALARWSTAPQARANHPREEHLLPLHVAAGAAGDDPGTVVFDEVILGVRTLGVRFG